MDKRNFSVPLSVKAVQVEDAFWKKEMELIRREVIPYQWEALNDRIPGAAPSFCMHNFKTAVKQNRTREKTGTAFEEPVFTYRGFEALPEDPARPEDKFYGFVFQDSDFYKWIEAVGYCLAFSPDPELERIADEAIEIVCGAQQKDGYLDTYYILNGKDRIFTNLRDHHELYCLGHLLEGAVAYYQATGKRKLLDAACRFADYAGEHFGPEAGKCKGYPGHEIAEMALIRLYEATGEEKYLNLSLFFIDRRGTRPYYFELEENVAKKREQRMAGIQADTCEAEGAAADAECQQSTAENAKAASWPLRYQYHQAHLPVREQSEAVGHAVRAVYLYSGMTDAARVTGDESLFQACEKLWEDVVSKKLYITGGIGATRHGEAFSFAYDLPNDTAYAETCAAIGMVFWARRMLEIQPDSKYGDVMERALYNCVLSGMALDGRSFFYVNPLETVPKACHEDENKSHVKPVRQKWFGCACCPPNLARLISSVNTYAYTENEDTLFVHLYMGSTVTKKVNGQEIKVHVESGFPWNGRVCISVELPKGAGQNAMQPDFTLALRIPGWAVNEKSGQSIRPKIGNGGNICSDFLLSSKEGLQIREEGGYLYVTGDWGKNGEKEQGASAQTEKQIRILHLEFPMEIKFWQANTNVREDIGKVAVTRGPVTYCAEEADNGKDLHLLTLDCEKSGQTEELEIAGNRMISLLLKGYRQTPVTDKGLYYSVEHPVKEPAQIRLIPYYAWANRGENEMLVWMRG